MTLSATLALALAFPQLRVEPYRSELGQEVVVTAEKDGAALPAVEVTVQHPDGSRETVGRTDERGELRLVVDRLGEHVARVRVGELRMLAPYQVVRVRSRWWTAAVCVPLGLALLWRSLAPRRSR